MWTGNVYLAFLIFTHTISFSFQSDRIKKKWIIITAHTKCVINVELDSDNGIINESAVS